ncbi:MAG: HXXEE domain-containing protein [Tractidigestivibacter sp.]|jgi:hypothetical protein|uniref:HXXEE domain-containing protein n=1 Tax=Tractidigestivibacter sp. TaxID=2847320 RepID=UPI003D94633F
MARKFVYSWYKISAYVAGAIAIVLAMGVWNLQQRMVLASMAVLFLHFFEEFGCPGGFPRMGLYVEMKITDRDARHWSLNQLNALFGNWWFAIVVFGSALALPDVRFLTLTVALFAFLEVAMHLMGFPLGIKRLYNPGLGTAVFGLLPVSLWYLAQTVPTGAYTGWDVLLALAWIVFNYWLVFRSPLYTWMGSKSGTWAFTEEEVALSDPFLKNVDLRAKR